MKGMKGMKEEIFRRILAYWQKCPGDLRFGQFLINAVGDKDLFYVTDRELVAKCNEYVQKAKADWTARNFI